MPGTDRPQGNPQGLPPEPVATPQGAPAAEAYFEYALPNGEKETYATRDDLTRAYRESFLRQSDYTRKTQELAKMRKEYEDKAKKFEEDQKAFLKTRSTYDDWDRKLKENPSLYRTLEQQFSQGTSPSDVFERAQGYADEKYKALQERFEALEKKISEGDSKREIEEAFAELEGKYEDADRSAILERLEMLHDGKVGPLVEQLYWAAKGQVSPAKIEERVVEGLKAKAGAKMVPPAAGGPKGPPPKYKSTDEAREAAFAAEGIHP